MTTLAITLTTGELKTLIYALELAYSLNDDRGTQYMLKSLRRKVTQNVKEI